MPIIRRPLQRQPELGQTSAQPKQDDGRESILTAMLEVQAAGFSALLAEQERTTEKVAGIAQPERPKAFIATVIDHDENGRIKTVKIEPA